MTSTKKKYAHSFEVFVNGFISFGCLFFILFFNNHVTYVSGLWLRIDWFNILLGLPDFEIDDAL